MNYLEAQFVATLAIVIAWTGVAIISNLIDADFNWDPLPRQLALLGGLSLILAPAIFYQLHSEQDFLAEGVLIATIALVSWLYVRLHKEPLDAMMPIIMFATIRLSITMGVALAFVAFR